MVFSRRSKRLACFVGLCNGEGATGDQETLQADHQRFICELNPSFLLRSNQSAASFTKDRANSRSDQTRKANMKRKASAVWRGGLKDGKGAISMESGTLKEAQYSFGTRFENGVGTNPEELIAAAHAGCFSMAFSAELGKAGITPESINTTATITMEKTDAGFSVTQSHLDVTAKVPGADQAKVIEIANAAKAGCPISRVLKANITMDAKVEV